MICNGVPLQAVLDSGCEITCINRNCLPTMPVCADRNIYLNSAFGDKVQAKLADVALQLPEMLPNDDKLIFSVAVTDKLSADCLLSTSHYRQLQNCLMVNLSDDRNLNSEPTVILNEYAITRAQQRNLNSANASMNESDNECDSLNETVITTIDNSVLIDDCINSNNSVRKINKLCNDNVTSRSDSNVDDNNKACTDIVRNVKDVNSKLTMFPVNDVKSDVFKLRTEQHDDDTLAHIFQRLSLNDTSDVAEEYFIHSVDGLLYHKATINTIEVHQLVVPEGRRPKVMEIAHSSPWANHLGPDKTLYRVKLSFFWPGMRDQIMRYTQSCKFCQLRKRNTVYDRVPIEPVIRCDEAFQVMHIDCLGPIVPKSKHGHNYVLCVVDSFSKWLECVPLKNVTAKNTCDALLHIFARTSIPRVIKSDNATNFKCTLTAEFEKLLGITPTFSTPGHSEGNGVIERQILNFKNCLHHVIREHGSDWDSFVPFILWSLREVPNATTGCSPMQLVCGRQNRGPLSVLKDVWCGNIPNIPVLPVSTEDYLTNLRDRLNVVARIAEANSEKAQDVYKKQYNKRAKTKHFDTGDLVIVLEKNSGNKILSQWVGPCEIINQESDNSYLVQMPNEGRRLIHANSLKKFVNQTDFVGTVNNSVTKPTINVNLVGVINEEDTEHFGDVVEIPIMSKTQQEDFIDFKSIIDDTCQHISDEQRIELTSILEKHRNVFSSKPGLCKVGHHSIRIKENEPIPHRKLYPVPISLREEVDKQIKELLDADIIERSTSPYAHPIVCVRKPDKSIRMCVDYRAVNSITVDDRYPLANANELLMTVGKAQYITSLDCNQAFFQLNLLDDGSRERSAFFCHSGLYQFKRMSFGLKSASSSYQRTMDEILRDDKDYANAFIDDIAVHSEQWELHLKHIDRVLTKIGESGLKLKISKCKFAQKKVKYLGHIVGGNTHTPDPEKVSAVANLMFPATKRQMKSLMGLISYYRNYIPNLADIAKPLTDMTKRNGPCNLTPGENEMPAFHLLKQKLINAPILRCPDFDKPFIIQADASKYAIGSCLAQEFDGEEHPIAFASAKLTGSQLNWSTVEREGYAIIHALKKFDNYIYGREIKIVTDHNPLTYITDTAPENPKLVRWKLSLQRYNTVSVSHRSGSSNGNCDALSRLLSD